MEYKSKIPVTVITGFLGAGKTTLINNLLEKYSDLQFALVENEFGDVAIDTKLIKGVDASQMFELKQGCICCTITDEYELVLQELAERFPDVEHLLIETTGIADPAGVIQPFFRDEQLKELYRYNGTICLVDALHFNEQPEQELRLKQLAVADLILINKSKILDEQEKELMLKWLGKLNPFAKLLFTNFGNVTEIDLNNLVQKIRTTFDFITFPSSHAHIETKLIEFEGSMPKAEFLRWFSYLMDVNKRNIYRAKGLLYFEDDPFEYILQGLGGDFELTEGDLIIEPGESKIVLIGKFTEKMIGF